MLKKLFCGWPAMALAVASVCLAAEQPGPARMLARLPAAVQTTIRAQVGAGKVIAIEKSTGDEAQTFDVEMTRDGRDRSFTVAADGALLDCEVFLAELPAAVQRTIQAHLGTGTLGEIDRCVDGSDTTYEAEMTRDGKTRGFTVGADGELLDEEVFIAELPPAIQKTVQTELGNGTLDEIDKCTDGGETNYDVEFTRGGRSRSFTVGTGGALLRTEVFLSELPVTLQKSIQAQLGGGRAGEITKCTDDDVTYEVEVTPGNRTRTLTFDPDGTLISEEEETPLANAPQAVRTEIQSLAGKGTVIGLSKVTEDKDVSYDVEIKVNGERKFYSLGADGKLLPDDAK